MKKSIKAISTMAVAAAVAFTSAVLPATTVKADVPTQTLTDSDNNSYEAIDNFSLGDSDLFYTIAGGSTKVAWAPLALDNIMESTDYDGVYSMKLTLPAYDDSTDEKRVLNEFKFCVIDSTVFGDGWDHALIAGSTKYGDNMSRFRVENEEEGEFTVYWDTTTGALVILDADGEEVDYKLSLVGYDNELVWTTVDELKNASWSDYANDKAAIAQAAGVTEIPDLASLNEALATKLSGDPADATTAATEGATTTVAATTAAATTAAATTTAANATAKTGDAMPVAMLGTLCVAAAIVAVARKKEA